MKPFIHADTDVVVIEKAVHPLRPSDIALYKKGKSEYVLHRIIKCEGDRYVLLGDNCVTLEYVPKDAVIGVMKSLLRNGKEVKISGLKNKIYKNLWIKPWRARIFAIRVRNKLRRTLNLNGNK